MITDVKTIHIVQRPVLGMNPISIDCENRWPIVSEENTGVTTYS